MCSGAPRWLLLRFRPIGSGRPTAGQQVPAWVLAAALLSGVWIGACLPDVLGVTHGVRSQSLHRLVALGNDQIMMGLTDQPLIPARNHVVFEGVALTNDRLYGIY